MEVKSVPNAPPASPDVSVPTPATPEVQSIANKVFIYSGSLFVILK